VYFIIDRTHSPFQPAEFDVAYRLAKQASRTNSAKEQFEFDRRFWYTIFEKARCSGNWTTG
jgi:hypothetical protein